MPFPLWTHVCPTSGVTTYPTEPTPCPACGATPHLHGWARSLTESWGHYIRCYGLAPFGPHRRMADELLKDIVLPPCESCGGQGVHDIRAGKGYRDCEVCDGFGHTSLPWDEIAQVRAQVLAVYPDVAAPFPQKTPRVVPPELVDLLGRVDVAEALQACGGLDLAGAIADVVANDSPEWVLAVARRCGWAAPGTVTATALLELVVRGERLHSCVVDVLGRRLVEALAGRVGVPPVAKVLRTVVPAGPVRRGMPREQALRAFGESYGPSRRVHWLTSSGVRPYPEELAEWLHPRLTRFEADRLNEVLDHVRSPEEALGLIRAQRP